MKNNLKKLLVLLLAANMFAGATLPTFAEEVLPENGTEVVENEDGTKKEITTTVTEETDEEGNTTITVKIEETIDETTGNVTDDGVTIDYEQTTVTTTTTNEEGEEIESSKVVDGSETKSWTEEDSGDEEGQPEVEVELIPGEKTEATAEETTVTGDEENGTVTTVTDRTVTAEVTDIEITVNDSNTGLVGDQETGLKGLDPVYDETDEIKYRTDGKYDDDYGKDGLFDRNYLSGSNMDPSKWTEIPPEGEYRYVGTGEHSKYFVGLVKVIYKKDENGNTVYDENGNPIIEKLVNNVTGADHTSDGELVTEIIPEYEFDSGFSSSRAQNFMLMDKNGNRVFAYCCDAQTGAETGRWYSVSNLEDSEYYTEGAEDHIRDIVMNGYWGTSDIPDENGNYEIGSLESIKDKMLKAIENGEIERYVQVPVRDTTTDGAGKIQVDENGNPIYYEEKMDLCEIILGMTEGEALLATQAAIWSFANGSLGAISGIDGPVVISPDWYRNHQIGYKKVEGEPLDDAAGARVAAIYNWLMNLDADEESTVVINEKNFVEDVSLIVKDKVADHENNLDDNEDNDVYHTDLNFTLAFIPGENDDLLVQITYTDLDGKPVTVVRRLAGENAEGQSYEDIRPEEDGSYVLKGLKLSENQDFDFDLRLEGTQYLEQGVYVYAPVGGRDVSQTFVGIAEGERNVDVSMGMTIKFDVDEDNHVVAERHWHEEIDPEIDPEDPTPDPEPKDPKPEPKKPTPKDPEPKPEEPTKRKFSFKLKVEEEPEVVEIPEEEIPLVNIPDEEIPLTNIPDEPVPMTGDSMFWYISSAAAVLGLCVLNLFGKKKNHNA